MLNISNCRDRVYVEQQLMHGQTMLNSSYCSDRLCLTAVTAGTDCLLNISNRRDRVYVEQQLLQGQTVC
jgi:hypothetical protein